MTSFAITLKDTIDKLFEGNQRNFSRAAKISGAQVTKLLKGGNCTETTLNLITEAVPTSEAIDLCRAAIRDYIPTHLLEEVTEPEPPGRLAERETFNQADPKSEAILRKLRFLVLKDPEARQWLHKTGDWIFPNETQD